MLKRRTTGSVICPACGSLVGVNDDKCYSCGRLNPGMWGFAPLFRQLGAEMVFAPLVIGGCVVLYVFSLLASGGGIGGGSGLNFLSPSSQALAAFGSSGAIPILQGRWWTPLSATWLHAGLLHLLFNMMAVRNLAPATVDLIGPGRTTIIYVVSGVTGFLLTSFLRVYFPNVTFLQGAAITVGASASVCGLIGALTHYGRKSGSSIIRDQTAQWAIMIAVSGLLFQGTDNAAHLGGFIGGYVLSAFLNPLTRERGDHVLLAGLSLLASLLAVVASVWVGWARI